LILPIDSHPDPIYRIDGAAWRNRVQLYDATFGTERADSFTLHVNGRASYIRGQAANPLFDDTHSYWNTTNPGKSAKLPGAGVTLRVQQEKGTSMKVRLASKKVSSAAAATR